MPSQSKAQQRFMGMVHAAQKGELDNPSKEVEKVAKDMDKSDVKDFASTKHKGLPNHVKQEILKRVKEYAIVGDKHVKYPANNEPLRSDDEMDIQEDRIPQNFNVGVASDYHTKVATTPRKKYDDTNFDKENSGQQDLEESTGDELEMLKLTVKAMKSMPSSPRQKEYIKQLNALRIKNGLKPLAETYIKEWGSELDNSFILNQNAKLDGTPKEKDAIDRDIDESTTPSDIIKDLDKVRTDLIKKVDVLIAKKKKLYSNVDIESPMSADEKQLDKDIQSIFSQIQSIIQQKRKIKESVNESWEVKDGKVSSNGKLIGYYEFDRDSDSFWVDDVKKGKGQLSFDTKKEVEDYFKKNEKDAVKHLGKLRESVNEEKVYIDYLNKKKGFKQDRITFNSYEEAVKWARKNFEKFNSDMIKYESVNEEQSQQKEMIDGIVEMLKQVEDMTNRKEMALDRLNDFKKEGIEVDEVEFLQRCGLESINESPESLQKELEYQLKWAYTHFKQNPKDSRYEKVVKDTIDKIKQLKKTGRLENVNESTNPREDALLKTFKDIVKNHSSLKVKDGGRTILVDVQSANVVLKLYDALSDSNKKSLLKMPVGKMIKMAWHVMGKK